MVRLVAPALAEEFLVLMVTWTDWWLAGHYFAADGDATKTAMGLMAYVMWLLPSMFAAVAIGATALIARWSGSKETARANAAANQAYSIAIVIAIIVSLSAWLFGNDFIRLMQLTGASATFALEYLDIVAPTIPFIMCSQIGAACLRGAGDTVTGFIAKLIVVVTNILVSTALVSGWGLWAPIGWKGIAIGTATGYTIGGLLILAVMVRGRAGLQLRFGWMKPDWQIIGKLLRIGLPGGFDIAILLFSQLIFLAIINSLGKESAAAHGLAVQIEACTFLPGAAFQVASATMAGQFLGAKLPDRAVSSVKLCLGVGMTIMCLGGLALFFAGHEIAYFFTGDFSHPTTLQTAVLLKIVSMVMPCLAIVMIINGALRGAGDTFWPFIITSIGFFLVRIPLAAWLALDEFSLPQIDISIAGLGWESKEPGMPW
jgi:putative MATE family efflux protein